MEANLQTTKTNGNGHVITEADYLLVAARIAWFRKDHPYWSIINEIEEMANKAVLMKATIKDFAGNVIATARKKETEIGFPDYIKKAEKGAIGRALARCGPSRFKEAAILPYHISKSVKSVQDAVKAEIDAI